MSELKPDSEKKEERLSDKEKVNTEKINAEEINAEELNAEKLNEEKPVFMYLYYNHSAICCF